MPQIGDRVRVEGDVLGGECGVITRECVSDYDVMVRLDGWRNAYPFHRGALRLIKEVD